ncbi:hypothetical protein ACFQ9X_51985 [Catenulispora yoronensis]
MAERLADERRSLRMLRTGGESVEAAFAVSYRQLDAARQRAFRVCAVPDVPDFDTGLAAAVLRCPAVEAEELLEGLVDLGLLGSARPGRYAYHDLMRQYARAIEDPSTPAPDAQRTVTAATEYLRGGAVAAYERLLPGDMLVGKFTVFASYTACTASFAAPPRFPSPTRQRHSTGSRPNTRESRACSVRLSRSRIRWPARPRWRWRRRHTWHRPCAGSKPRRLSGPCSRRPTRRTTKWRGPGCATR